MKKVLTIAGSDSTGGAGVQADLKTFEEYGVFGFSSITTIVTMDPTAGWTHEITQLPTELLEKQLTSVFAGGKVAAIKTGMMGDEGKIELASRYLTSEFADAVVIDPVIACKGTAQILQPENVAAMKQHLLPKATVTTPNLIEAGILSEMGDLTSVEEMKEAARRIHLLGAKNVVVKGGHRLGAEQAIDVVYDGQEFVVLENELYRTDFNHGAGCTFAAATAAGLAKGATANEAIALAKRFVAAGIANGVSINPYVGHVWHGAYNEAQNRMLQERN